MSSERNGKPDEYWDAFVAGAGPAGATAARLLAGKGLSVLLVDRCAFPRDKVCGGCLNGAALRALEQSGLGGLLDGLGAHRLDTLELRGYGRRAHIPLPSGCAISRRALDSALAWEAQRAGAVFRPETTARLGAERAGGWLVDLKPRAGTPPSKVHAGVVLAADGLEGGFLRGHPRFSPVVAADAKIGLGVLAATPAAALRVGEIRMTVGPEGYVGLVRREDGLVDVAAAIDRRALGGSTPEAVLRGILKREGALAELELIGCIRGTPHLTRHRRIHGGRRIFLVGDATGYVEPFTGEGIAWALNSALRVAPLAEAARERWSESLRLEWERIHRRKIFGSQSVGRILRNLLGRPLITGMAIHMTAVVPGWTRPLVAGLNRPISERR